jgi:pimeloyl-ACP methyl ester carboxylesterase
MPKIDVNGIVLHHITVGSGPDLVLVHGFLGNLAVWHLNMAPQLRRDFRVVTYDMRGHGYSQMTPSGYTPADMAEDLRGLLDTLNIKRAYLAGHSYGADVCMYFSLLYPERVEKLIALEPGLAALVHQRKHEAWAGWALWAEKLAEVGIEVDPERRNDIEYLLELSLNTPKFYGPARGLPRNREPLLKLLRETTIIQDYEHVGELTLEAVRRIETPTLLVYGDQSHFLSSFEALRKLLPNCTPLLLPGGEHFGPLEQPELLTEHIRSFVFRGEPAWNDPARLPYGGALRSAAQAGD